MDILERIREQEELDLLFIEEEMAMYCIYFFDQRMNVVGQIHRVVKRKPHRWADAQCKRNGWYTYAIGVAG